MVYESLVENVQVIEIKDINWESTSNWNIGLISGESRVWLIDCLFTGNVPWSEVVNNLTIIYIMILLLERLYLLRTEPFIKTKIMQ